MSVSQDTHADTVESSRTEAEATTITLANSVVELERGPAGVVGRVRHASGHTEYAGPLPDATIDALREVGR